jgi:outer membrane protein
MAFGTDLKIGVVNFDYIITNSEAGKRNKDKIQAKVKGIEDSLKKDETDLQKLQEEIQKKGMALSQEAQKGKIEELRAKAAAYETKRRNAQDELGKAEQDIFKPMLDTLLKVTQDYAKRNGITLVLSSKQSVAYTDPAFDLTRPIMDEFNKAGKK